MTSLRFWVFEVENVADAGLAAGAGEIPLEEACWVVIGVLLPSSGMIGGRTDEQQAEKCSRAAFGLVAGASDGAAGSPLVET